MMQLVPSRTQARTGPLGVKLVMRRVGPSSRVALATAECHAVPFGEGFTRDEQDDGSNPDAEAIRASTIKLLDLVEREHSGLVIFGHDKEQWETLKKAPEFYE